MAERSCYCCGRTADHRAFKRERGELVCRDYIGCMKRGFKDDPSCPHSWRHTVYGSDDPDKNGTWCELCGKKL